MDLIAELCSSFNIKWGKPKASKAKVTASERKKSPVTGTLASSRDDEIVDLYRYLSLFKR